MYTHTLREAAWEASKPSSSPYIKKKIQAWRKGGIRAFTSNPRVQEQALGGEHILEHP